MFDAYHKWLGIPPSEQPPNYYRLLAIDLFESDADVISNAADQRMAHLRTFQSGSRSALSQKLLNEIAAARVCLLNSAKKAEYDRRLKEQLAAKVQAAEPAQPQTASAPADIETRHPPRGFSSVAAKYRARRKRNLIATLATVLMTGVVCAAVVFLLARSDLLVDAPVVAPPASKQDRKVDPPLDSAEPPDRPAAKPDLLANPPAALSEQARQRLHARLDAVRKAMAARSLTRAEELLEPARRAAESSDLREEVDRVAEILRLLGEFWAAAETGAARLKSGDTLTIDGVDAAVVEATSEQITIQSGGQQLRFAVQSLPSNVVLDLARRGLAGGEAAANLRIGTFLAIDYYGDRTEARRLWDLAGPEGRRLLPELGLAPPVRPAEAVASGRSQSPMMIADDADQPEPALPQAVQKHPIPGTDSQAELEAEVRESLAKDFEQARNADGRQALIAKLRQSAETSSESPDQQYVLYRLAMEQAVEAGDPNVLCEIIDAMDQRFEDVDPLMLKGEKLAAAYRARLGVPHRQEIAQRCEKLLEEAMQANYYAAAEKLVRVALQYYTSNDAGKARQLGEIERKIKAAQRSGT